MKNENNEIKSLTIEENIINFMFENNIILEFVNKIESFQVDRYFFKVKNNAKIKKIASVIDELQLRIKNEKIKLEVDNKSGCVVFELSKAKRKILNFEDLKDTNKEGLTACIGQDLDKNNINIDISKAPHILIAGATGTGKSCLINDIITSLINKYSEEELQLILFDVKKVEFLQYNNCNNLAIPVVSEIQETIIILNKICKIMDNRYNYLAQEGFKNIQDYNNNSDKEHMNYYLLVIDEFSDLIMQVPEIEKLIIRIAQLGRACGIHLLIATQRPSREVITGLIKANIPTRIALSVNNYYDSKIILDEKGAEKLTGRGDFLLKYADGSIIRGQAALI